MYSSCLGYSYDRNKKWTIWCLTALWQGEQRFLNEKSPTISPASAPADTKTAGLRKRWLLWQKFFLCPYRRQRGGKIQILEFMIWRQIPLASTVHLLCRNFVCLFVCLFVRSFIHSLARTNFSPSSHNLCLYRGWSDEKLILTTIFLRLRITELEVV